jgi:hypothetical protein
MSQEDLTPPSRPDDVLEPTRLEDLETPFGEPEYELIGEQADYLSQEGADDDD